MVPVSDDLANLPEFYDDASPASLNNALSESISYWRQQDPERQLQVCDKSYRAVQLLDTLLEFKKILRHTPKAELSEAIAQNFTIYQAKGSNGGDTLVTGYFQPVLRGSLVRQPPYIYPIYGLPPDLIKAASYDTAGKSQILVGRLADERLRPYWQRSEIEDNNVLAGREILYLSDPVDVFVLHVQGSGLVVLPDGSKRQILYAGSNGWPYRSIGRLLVDEGKMTLSEVSMPKIRQYLLSHLDERRQILHYNKRYIFFRLKPVDSEDGPVGAMGRRLTAGRSVAADVNCFPLGALCYLTTEIPVIDGERINGWRAMQRFVLAQDSGAAIKGSGRLDMFLGHGAAARKVAGEMRQLGQLYFIIKK
jgi:membrane-bound lytic murein transglycosylase A